MKNMLKGKNLLLLALVGGGAYWYWMKMKKDKAAAAKPATAKAAESAANGMPYVNAFGLSEHQRKRIARIAQNDIERAQRVAMRRRFLWQRW